MTIRDLTILGCSSQQPTRHRNHGAYVLRWNEEGLLFDPGEGTQRQFIFANMAPTTVTYIFVSHFHGDHCLGVGSMLMRLNLDKVTHPVRCFFPKAGEKYFHRLRYGTMYHQNIEIIEYPIDGYGLVYEDEKFEVRAFPLHHGVANLAWRVTEKSVRKFDAEKLAKTGLKGMQIKEFISKGVYGSFSIDDVSYMRAGETFACVIDTLPCQGALQAAENAELLLCESTYLDAERALAKEHRHLTALQAAHIAKDAGAKELILTHFSARYMDVRVFESEARTIFPEAHAAEDLKVFLWPR